MSSSTPWTRPPNPSANLRVALTYLSALEQWDERKLMDTFDETLTHQILPKSLRRPLLNKKHFGVYFRGLASLFERGCNRRTIHEVIEAGDMIILHVSATDKSITGHDYENEYMIILRMMNSSSGDGTRKIGSVKEFVDSYASTEFFPKEKERVKRAQAQASTR